MITSLLPADHEQKIKKQKEKVTAREGTCVFLFHCDCDVKQPEAIRAFFCGFSVLWLTSIHHGKPNVSRQGSRDGLGVSETGG